MRVCILLCLILAQSIFSRVIAQSPGFFETAGKVKKSLVYQGFKPVPDDYSKIIFQHGNKSVVLSSQGFLYQFAGDVINEQAGIYRVVSFSEEFIGSTNGVVPLLFDVSGQQLTGKIEYKDVYRVLFKNVWEGIDVEVISLGDHFKYNFIGGINCDYQKIRMGFSDKLDITVGEKKGLIVRHPLGYISESKPVAIIGYDTLDIRFKKFQQGQYGFDLNGNTVLRGPFVIDPEVNWASYFGSKANELFYDIAIDDSSNAVLLGGVIGAPDLGFNAYRDTAVSMEDVLVFKMTTSGVPVWCTYLGGNSQDYGSSLVLDKQGNIYVSGATTSQSGFGFGNSLRDSLYKGHIFSAKYDNFLVKLSPQGFPIWGTYVGGEQNDVRGFLAFDTTGYIYDVISTNSWKEINTGTNPYDSVSILKGSIGILKFDTAGNLIWGKYLDGNNQEEPRKAVIDKQGNLVIAGVTGSNNLGANSADTTFAGSLDCFISVLDSSGNVKFLRYVGETGFENNPILAVSDESYYLGLTVNDSLFLSRNGLTGKYNGASDLVLLKMDNNLVLKWVRNFGGTSSDGGYALHVNDNIVTAVGSTNSNAGIFFKGFDNYRSPRASDAFIANYDTAGVLLWSSYIGGDESDEAMCVASTRNNALIVAGKTSSSNYFNKRAFQDTLYDGLPPYPDPDIFLMKICHFSSDSFEIPFHFCIGDTVLVGDIEIYRDTVIRKYFEGMLGCDSIALNQYYFHPPSYTSINYYLCNGDSIQLPSGEFTSTVGNYVDTISGVYACDSIVSTTVLQRFIEKDSSVHLCYPDSFISPSGIWLKDGDALSDTAFALTGCDTVWNFHVYVHNPSHTLIIDTLCSKDLLWLPSGKYAGTTGVYWDTIPGFYGCDSVFEAHLTFLDVDTMIVLIENELRYTGNDDFIAWLNCADYSIVSTDTSFRVLSSGNYAVLVSNRGCIDTGTCYYFTVPSGISLNDVHGKYALLSPNPSGGVYSLKFAGLSDPVLLKVYNMAGQLVSQYREVKSGDTIDLSIMPPGVYTVRIVDNQQVQVDFRVMILK